MSERQYGTTLAGIRADHVARYRWAAAMIRIESNGRAGESRVLDAACGCGYGAAILADSGCRVAAIDRSAEAIRYGMRHWQRPAIAWTVTDLEAPMLPPARSLVSFETIEHIEDPRMFLRVARAQCARLYASVPNEDVIPKGVRFRHHFRHYTKGEFAELLQATGWKPQSWWGQDGTESEVEAGVNGRTLVVACS
jgi:SAM-dependent methyltransferase